MADLLHIFVTIFVIGMVSCSDVVCPINEVYQEGGPLCEGCGPRCLALTDEAKCYCKPGHSRLHGICISDSACPNNTPTEQTCPPNEAFSLCGSGCPETCEDANQPGGKACAAVCVEGCFCISGFIRNNQGLCVPRSECKPTTTCPPNEEFLTCGSGCAKTCDDITEPAQRGCAAVCVEGCFCKAGLVRNKQGICVPPQQCMQNPICPLNEEYSKCGSGCAPTCDDIKYPGGRACPAVCIEGCFCKKGLVRNKLGICIPPTQCPSNIRCPINEVPGCKQPPGCQTCDHKPICPTFVCDPGCVCRPGFYRRNGICIPEFFCSYGQPRMCPPFETFRFAGPACEGCYPRCQAISYMPKCYCNYPYVRINGVCRPPFQCPLFYK